MSKPTRQPDIGFWFDGKGFYYVRVQKSVEHDDLCVALVDLLAKAIESTKNINIGEDGHKKP